MLSRGTDDDISVFKGLFLIVVLVCLCMYGQGYACMHLSGYISMDMSTHGMWCICNNDPLSISVIRDHYVMFFACFFLFLFSPLFAFLSVLCSRT